MILIRLFVSFKDICLEIDIIGCQFQIAESPEDDLCSGGNSCSYVQDDHDLGLGNQNHMLLHRLMGYHPINL
jgi:hypothetical protein